MPKLPSPADYGASVPRPSRGVTQIQPNPMGQAVSNFGAELGKLADEETQRLEELAAQDALNALERKQMEMLYDPEKGVYAVKGMGVLSRPLQKEVPEAFDKEVKALTTTLKTPRAQAFFSQRAEGMKTQLSGKVFAYVAAQTEAAHEQTEKGTQDNQVAKVAQDPSLIEGALAIAAQNTAKMIKRLGLDPSRDKDQIALIVQSSESAIVSAAVRRLIADENAQGAEVYLKTYKDRLRGAEYAALKPLVDKNVDFAVGSELAARAAELPATEAAEFMRKESKGKAGVYRAAQEVFGNLERARDDKQKAKFGSVLLPFNQKPSSALRSKIERSAEFMALPVEDQNAAAKYMREEVEQADARARVRSDEAKIRKSEDPDTLAEFSRLISLPDLGAKPAGWGVGHGKILGSVLANKLEEERARQAAGAKRFSIDKDLVKAAMPESIAAGKEAAVAAKRNAFHGLVESYTQDWKEKHPGETPAPDEQHAILREVTKTYTLSVPWQRDPEAAAYELKPMPEDFIRQAREDARKARLPPPTRQQLIEAWSRNREAYK